jgi:putative MATE family efflux protein
VAEPLFLLTDSAIVGHLGTPQLAGLGVASAMLLTAANIFVFLAYGTTSVVARQLGAGNRNGAIAAGIDGTWLAVGLGAVTAVLVAAFAGPICRLFGASPEALDHAVTYLRISAISIPAMLVVLATTGVLRGLQDTKTPLIASALGFTSNIALNVLFVYGFNWGIGGSALGTVIAQTGMAVALVAVLMREAARSQVTLRAHPGRILGAARTGVPLLIRTLALRAVLLTTTWVAAGLGDVPLAAYQVSAVIWSFLVFALDALAIAAQAITGKALGAGDLARTRSATTLMIRWGVIGGVVLGIVVLLLHTTLPRLFTSDPAVQSAIAAALIIVALSQPLSGYAFVIDGVLIGAGDGKWLARAMLANFLAYLPLILGVHLMGDWLLEGGSSRGSDNAVTWLWLAFTAFMAIRGVLMWARVRTDTWMVPGATR